jgi:hypothetical protein
MRPLVMPSGTVPVRTPRTPDKAPDAGPGASEAAPAPDQGATAKACDPARPPKPFRGDSAEWQAQGSGRAPRRVTTIPAVLTYPGFGIGMPCKILNMSVTGALVELPRPQQGWYLDINDIPADITLIVKLDRVILQGRIVRRIGREIGVNFTAAPRPI